MDPSEFDLPLRKQVERVVRPLHAEFERKMRMREELLALIEQIYGEELARADSTPAALERTLDRFGDPAELSRELQATVPRREIWGTWLDRRLARGAQESALRYALRLAALLALLFVLVTAVAEGLLFATRGSGLDGIQVKLVAALVGMATLNALAIVLLGDWYCRSVEQNSFPLWRVTRLWLGAILVVATLTLAGISIMALIGGSLREVAWAARHWLTSSPAVIAVYVGVSMLIASQRRRLRPWKQLEIE
jgi:hypothetical protein